jgi:glutathione-regulated potassium-efflux system ancillary protein KefF
MITLIYAHPYPKHSHAGKALLHAVHDLPGVHVRNLYELYPDFHIDVAAEQKHLSESQTIVLQHPLHWYHTPALLSLWFEKVLAYGWAYGHDKDGQASLALQGKRMLWAATAGGEKSAYSDAGSNHFSMERMATPIQQTALFCGMTWLEPYTVYHAAHLNEMQLLQAAEGYRDRLVAEIEWLKSGAWGAPAHALAGGGHAR